MSSFQYVEDVIFVVFALINIVWSTLYLESWKRRSAEFAYKWGTLDKEDELLVEPRPLFTVSDIWLHEFGQSGGKSAVAERPVPSILKPAVLSDPRASCSLCTGAGAMIPSGQSYLGSGMMLVMLPPSCLLYS